jgi:phage baseplate assembly protein W
MSLQRRSGTIAHLGKGWRYPILPVQPRGALELTAGTDKVQQSIWIILDTDPGERAMRPTFGCGLRRYLMKPNTHAVRALIKHDVELALAAWEPRIQSTTIDVVAGEDPALVEIRIDYVHVRDGRPGNLVYPFYLE